jgi:ribose transport system ATP-binding protein
VQCLIRAEKIWKYFGPNAALAAVDFSARPGEVHVLAGANGAGKSTLVKILYGALAPDQGRLFWKDAELKPLDIAHALDLGVAYIPQEPQLVPQLSVAENIFLGNQPARRLKPRSVSLVDADELRNRAGEIAAAVGLRAPLDQPASRLSVAEGQLVAIGRALARRAELLLLDEPTASLSPGEIGRLFGLMRALKQRGSSIIFITHRLEETEQVGDSITVLRDGRVVFAGPRAALSHAALVELMTGRALGQASRPAAGDGRQASLSRPATGEELLRAENVAVSGRVGPLSLRLHAGEILGIAGVVGSGRTSLLRALFGAEPESAGKIFVRGGRVRLRSPADAIHAGLALLTEDRIRHGLVPTASISTNVSLAAGEKFARRLLFDHVAEAVECSRYMTRLTIAAPSPAFPARLLSGGNQQKIMFARWLCAASRVFLLDEPTRGIDVEARQQVYRLVRELAAAGHGVLFVSSDLPEVAELATRILVLHRGRLCAELAGGQVDARQLLTLAMGEPEGVQSPRSKVQGPYSV